MDIMVGGIILAILALSIAYVRGQVAKGKHCIGCSHDGCGSCPCHQDEETLE